MLPRSMQNLAAVDLILFQDASDIGVFVVEHLVQEKDSALDWRQPLPEASRMRGKSIVHLRNETTFKTWAVTTGSAAIGRNIFRASPGPIADD